MNKLALLKYAILTVLFVGLSVLFVSYLMQPNPAFPPALPGSLVSDEPADQETPLRRGYFTDLSRDEVLAHYNEHFSGFRLNYPPEAAQTLIRDQTRSTFLEEIVHPFRESLFVNGFEPVRDNQMIIIDKKVWRQKITVRYVPSDSVQRIAIALASLVLVWLSLIGWIKTARELIKNR